MADDDAPSKTATKDAASVRLQVAAARQEESGQGIARMPRSAFQALGITEGDVVEIEVEPHANRIGGNDVIDLARLEHRDLCIARPRGQCPHHDRSAAAHWIRALPPVDCWIRLEITRPILSTIG